MHVGADRFLVLAHNRVPSYGHARYDATAPGARAVTWAGLFDRYDTDAHVTQYVDPEGPPARLSREALLKLPEGTFERLRYPLLALDLDNPDHGSWRTAEDCAQAFRLLRQATRAPGGMPCAPAAIYLTRSGARLLWRPKRPMEYDEAMRFQDLFAEDTQALGLPLELDTACLGQWGRLFRLPLVVREGDSTADSIYGLSIYHEGPTFDPDAPALRSRTIGRSAARRVSNRSTTSTGEMVLEPLPDLQAAREQVYVDGDPSNGYTRTGSLIRRRLMESVQRSGDWLNRGRRHVLMQHIEGIYPIEDLRNQMLMQGMSWLSASLVGRASLEAVFGLVEPMLAATDEQTDPPVAADRGASTWTDYAWGWLVTRWRQDEQSREMEREARQEAAEAEKRARATNAQEFGEGLLSLWADPPRALVEDPEGWVKRHAIVVRGRGSYWILSPRTYGYVQVEAGGMPLDQVLRQCGLGDILQLDIETKDGIMVPRREETLLRDYAVYCGSERTLYTGARYVQLTQREDETLDILNPAVYPNPKVVPTYNASADLFLDELVGGPAQGEKLRALLAHFQDIRSTKLPMILLVGSPSTGKSLLLNAVRQLWVCQDQPVTLFNLSANGDYNGHLGKTVLIGSDETSSSVLRGKAGTQFFDDCKTLVSGGRMQIREKYQKASEVQLNYRCLICSNDDTLPTAIVTMGASDVGRPEMLSQLRRMEVFFVPRRKVALTLARTKGWIDNMVLVNHIAWLATQPPERWRAVQSRDVSDSDFFRVDAIGTLHLAGRHIEDHDAAIMYSATGRDDDGDVVLDLEHESVAITLKALEHASKKPSNDERGCLFLSRTAKGVKAVMPPRRWQESLDVVTRNMRSDTLARNRKRMAEMVRKQEKVIRKPLDEQVAAVMARALGEEGKPDKTKWKRDWYQVGLTVQMLEAAERLGYTRVAEILRKCE